MGHENRGSKRIDIEEVILITLNPIEAKVSKGMLCDLLTKI
jgi:hypothetical protein